MTNNDPIIAEIVSRIEAEIAANAQFLTSDSCGSMKEYRRTTGKIKGLRTAKNIIDDVMRRMIEDDDES